MFIGNDHRSRKYINYYKLTCWHAFWVHIEMLEHGNYSYILYEQTNL